MLDSCDPTQPSGSIYVINAAQVPEELAEGARALLRAGASVRAGVLEPEAGVHAQGQHGYVFDPRDWDSGVGIGCR